MTKAEKLGRFARAAGRGVFVALGALFFTSVLFLVLPLMQSIHAADSNDTLLTNVDTGALPPPPDPIEEEPPPEEEPEPEEEPPQLEESAPEMDLAQLDALLNPSFGGAGFAPDFQVDLSRLVVEKGGGQGLFSVTDLDQQPRPVLQTQPIQNPKTRQKAPGTVVILFTVNEHGRVENPLVKSSDDPVFEAPAMAAVKQWRFEPGQRNGQPVAFRMSVPITFPKD